MLYCNYSVPVPVAGRFSKTSESQDIHIRIVTGLQGRTGTTHLYLKGTFLPLNYPGIVDITNGKIRPRTSEGYSLPEGSEVENCRVVGHWFGVRPVFGQNQFPADVITLIWNGKEGTIHTEFKLSEELLTAEKKALEDCGFTPVLVMGQKDRYFGQVRYEVSLAGQSVIAGTPQTAADILAALKNPGSKATKVDEDLIDLR